ncbi:MAG: hypothetical protein WDW38_002334 [Sanguina aurantia]
MTDTLFDHFLVIGLTTEALVTLEDEDGYQGNAERYMPGIVDALHAKESSSTSKLPPHLHICCLPGGVQIFPPGTPPEQMTPRVYSLVLTDETGGRLYTSVLCFTEEVPACVVSRHSALMGCRASKAVALLCRHPYLTTMEQVLRTLYASAFCVGMSSAVGDAVTHLLRVPSPARLNSQRRVLLRCSHYSLLTRAAEGIRQLLFPLRQPHVYIPVLPYALVDYLDAPTPFLMGLHPLVQLDPGLLSQLVVVDLDSLLARPLLEQLLQTLTFFAFLDEFGGQGCDPYAWFTTGCVAFRVLARLARQRRTASIVRAGLRLSSPPADEKPAVVLVAKCPAALLQPTKPVVHRMIHSATPGPCTTSAPMQQPAQVAHAPGQQQQRHGLALCARRRVFPPLFVSDEPPGGEAGRPLHRFGGGCARRRSASISRSKSLGGQLSESKHNRLHEPSSSNEEDAADARPPFRQDSPRASKGGPKRGSVMHHTGSSGGIAPPPGAPDSSNRRGPLITSGNIDPDLLMQQFWALSQVLNHGSLVSAAATPAAPSGGGGRCGISNGGGGGGSSSSAHPAGLHSPFSSKVVVVPPAAAAPAAQPPAVTQRRKPPQQPAAAPAAQPPGAQRVQLALQPAGEALPPRRLPAAPAALDGRAWVWAGAGAGLGGLVWGTAEASRQPRLQTLCGCAGSCSASSSYNGDTLWPPFPAPSTARPPPHTQGGSPGHRDALPPGNPSDNPTGANGIFLVGKLREEVNSSPHPPPVLDPPSSSSCSSSSYTTTGHPHPQSPPAPAPAPAPAPTQPGAGPASATGAPHPGVKGAGGQGQRGCQRAVSAAACDVLAELVEQVRAGVECVHATTIQHQTVRSLDPSDIATEVGREQNTLHAGGPPCAACRTRPTASHVGAGPLRRGAPPDPACARRPHARRGELVLLAAVRREDFGTVLSTLEVAMCFYCHDGCGGKARVLHKLSRCPVLYTSWLWSGAFAAALNLAPHMTDAAIAAAAAVPAAVPFSIVTVTNTPSPGFLTPHKLSPSDSGLPHMRPTGHACAAPHNLLAIAAATATAADPDDPNADPLPCGQLFSPVYIQNTVAASATRVWFEHPSPPPAAEPSGSGSGSGSGAGAGPSPARRRAALPSSCSTSAPSATADTPVLNELQLQQRVSHMEQGGVALGDLAVYMMHLGLPEGSCWQLLARLAAQALPEHPQMPGSMGLQSQTSSSLADTCRPPFDTRMAMKRHMALANNTLQTAVSAPLPRSPQQQQQQQQQHPPPSPTPPQPLQPGVTSHSDVQRSDSVRVQHNSENHVPPRAGIKNTEVDSRAGGGIGGRGGDAGMHATGATAQPRSEVEEAVTLDVDTSQQGTVHHSEPDPLTEGQRPPPVSSAREHASTAGAQEQGEEHSPTAPPARGQDAMTVQPTATATRLGVSRALSVPVHRGAAAAAAPRGSVNGRPATAARTSSGGVATTTAAAAFGAKPALLPRTRLSSAALASRAMPGPSGNQSQAPSTVGRGSSNGSVLSGATTGWDATPHGAKSAPQLFIAAASAVAGAFSGGGGGDAGRLHPVCVVPLPMMSSGSSVSAILLSGDSTSAAVAGPMAPVVTPSLAAVNTNPHNNKLHGGGGGSGRERESMQQHGVLLLDVANGRVVSRLQPAQGGRITKLCYSPAGSMILSASSDGSARLWDVRQRSARMTTACTIESGQGGISSLLMDLSRSWVVTGGWDGGTCAWDLRKPTVPTMVYQGHQGWVTHLSLLHHDNHLRLLTASTDWTAAVHDADSGARGLSWLDTPHPSPQCTLWLSPNLAPWKPLQAGQAPEIITTAWDGSLAVWSLDTGACLQQHHAHGSAVCMLAKYAEDRWVTAAEDNTVRLWRGNRQDRTAGQGQGSRGSLALGAVTPCSVLDAEARVVVSGSTSGAVCAWSVKALEGSD